MPPPGGSGVGAFGSTLSGPAMRVPGGSCGCEPGRCEGVAGSVGARDGVTGSVGARDGVGTSTGAGGGWVGA